jgi:hypothetical protein
MDGDRVLEFNCPLKMKIVLPKDCTIDEDELRRRIETAGPQLFKGFCDGCPHYRERK